MSRYLFLLALTVLVPSSAFANPWWTWTQFAIGGGYRGRLMITNKTITAWKGIVMVRHGNHQPWNGSWSVNGQDLTGQSEIQLDLDPNERIALSIDGDNVIRTGYLEIDVDYGSSSRALDVTLFIEYWGQDGRLLELISFPPSEATQDSFVFPIERLDNSDLFMDSGVAWWSYYTVSFEIVLILYDHQGNEVTRDTVMYSGQEANYLGQILDGIPSDFLGSLRILSQKYLMVEVLCYVENKADGSFQLARTPPQKIFVEQ